LLHRECPPYLLILGGEHRFLLDVLDARWPRSDKLRWRISAKLSTKQRRSRVMSKNLAGQVAVVTGASKGIGAAIAEQLAAAGAAVVVNYAKSRAGAEAVVQRIAKAGGKAVAVQADVSKVDDIRRLFAETKKAYDKLNILVNNAGIYEFAPLEEITAEHFHKQFDLNVLGLLLTTQEAVKHFGSAGGSVINLSSVAVTLAPPNAAVYSGTKAAITAITRSLAKELGPRNIRVNAVGPGVIETEGLHATGISGSDFERQAQAQTPLGRIGQPRDIAPAVAFLASPESSFITGETLYVTGGLR
jgi:3-oxoacyl-[acyl-carrier protein] reductase